MLYKRFAAVALSASGWRVRDVYDVRGEGPQLISDGRRLEVWRHSDPDRAARSGTGAVCLRNKYEKPAAWQIPPIIAGLRGRRQRAVLLSASSVWLNGRCGVNSLATRE